MRNQLVRLLAYPVLLLIAACATPPGPGNTPTASPIVLFSGPVRASRDLVNRYTCMNERPPICQCVGRLARSGDLCECHCPLAP